MCYNKLNKIGGKKIMQKIKELINLVNSVSTVLINSVEASEKDIKKLASDLLLDKININYLISNNILKIITKN